MTMDSTAAGYITVELSIVTRIVLCCHLALPACCLSLHATDRIRVNCLSPGMTLTPTYGDAPWVKDYQARSAAAVPLQRNGKAEEMAHAIAFLQTNLYVTGLTVDVDGGNIIKP